jgi:hypothetical protein
MSSTKCDSFHCDQEFTPTTPIYQSRDVYSNETVLFCLSCAMEAFGLTLEEILYCKTPGLKRIN